MQPHFKPLQLCAAAGSVSMLRFEKEVPERGKPAAVFGREMDGLFRAKMLNCLPSC